MALQKSVTIVSVVTEGQGGTLTLNLKCWLSEDDPATDEPVLDIRKSAYVKKGVEGSTKQQLVNRATTEIALAFQQVIDDYNNEQTLISMVNTTAVENGLTG